MSITDLKDNFGPGEPVSHRWYNEVAKRFRTMTGTLKDLPGFNENETQALMVINKTPQWVTVTTCTT